MSAEPITTAGRAEPSVNPRKDAIRLVGQALRKTDATETEIDEAIEALLELARE